MAEKAHKYQSKTWREKLQAHREGYPKIVAVPYRWAKKIGDGKMLILTPEIIDAYIKTIPKGQLTTINRIREKFAEKYHVDITCPLTTGIFVWISAGAAEENKISGERNITPYWRVLKEGGKLNPKFPGGVLHQCKYLEAEGFEVLRSNDTRNWTVKNYEKYLMAI